MSGQSWIEATADARDEVRGLAGSSDREEADRARAVLLSLDAWTSERIAAAFCVQATAWGIGAGFSVGRELQGCAPARPLVPSRRRREPPSSPSNWPRIPA